MATGNTALWLEQGERLLQELAVAIQHNTWWEEGKRQQAQEGYAVICAIVERLVCVLPNHLHRAASKLQAFQQDVFFAK